mmetsp:Transcript_13415/g.29601  ORF Transcript_13415/g.29601 Transcript_13415/m.29601 type:complete len:84 (-) Transcript_13415:1017-1268(-)
MYHDKQGVVDLHASTEKTSTWSAVTFACKFSVEVQNLCKRHGINANVLQFYLYTYFCTHVIFLNSSTLFFIALSLRKNSERLI